MRPKKIIITGGATRIGAAIAESLANYDTEITIHYNKSKSAALKLKDKLKNLGSQIHLLKADLNKVACISSAICSNRQFIIARVTVSIIWIGLFAVLFFTFFQQIISSNNFIQFMKIYHFIQPF